jgi:hypothetical protein
MLDCHPEEAESQAAGDCQPRAQAFRGKRLTTFAANDLPRVATPIQFPSVLPG